ncbi:zinc transporter ZIP1-like [Pollicipes pollicipes]|uniref:zinc transporter ZIP1-like n=1 Tax=Pollicipes pollicipes TaxID=41117 RepID=UPI001885092B|nr:zinc transporter ZIP1-like [Pollicipes pollicipes]
MSVVGAKLGGFAVLLLTSLVLGLLPFKLTPLLLRRAGTQHGRVNMALSCLQCFGGGILLATVFAHMLPEFRQSLSEVGPGADFPLAEVLLCVGMFTIYAIEELVTIGVRRSSGGGGGGGSSGNSNAEAPILKTASGGGDGGAGPPAAASRPDYGAVVDSAGGGSSGHGHSHSHMAPPANLGSFRVLIVAVALSVHSVFEGMAIGLEATETSAWLLTAAIATHKSIIAFCLGEQLATSPQPLRTAIITLLVFVLASPAGILIGMLASSSDGDVASQTLMTDVLQALAAGTILYVVLFEIISGERAKPGNGLVKLSAILVGFGFMLLVTNLVKEPEPESDGTAVTSASPRTAV